MIIMNKEERKQKIRSITQGQPFVTAVGTGKRLLYRGSTQEFRIVEIPMEFLVLNVENGRIASLVKSFEKEHRTLHPEVEEDAVILSQFLYEAHDKQNDRTKADLKKNGQLEAGIVTSDGIIVDGNRRFSLMWAIAHDPSSTPDEKARCAVFRTVVLPEDADEKEILRLETSFQMGTDEKVGYNAIEKYLHARDMKDQGFSIQDITEYMGYDKTSEVDVLLEVMDLIDEYLLWCDCDGIYTRLPRGFEDDLLKLNTACKKIRSGNIGWIPSDKLEEAENDLKSVCYDYIRLNMKSDDGFDFRAIASTANNNFLINEDVWKKFVEDWQSAVNNVTEDDIDEVLDGRKSMNDTKRLLDARDNKWREKTKDGLKEAFTNAANVVENKKERDKPGQLIKRAANALREVDLIALRTLRNYDEINEQIIDIQTKLTDIIRITQLD